MADVQYADKDTSGKRDYRASEAKLDEAVRKLNAEQLAFVVQLGDLIDEGEENLETILPIWSRLQEPRYSVLGNHDFCMRRDRLLKEFGMERAYYDFTVKGWRFIVLDGMQISTIGGWKVGSKPVVEARRLLAHLAARQAKNAVEWNGALGKKQREWLARRLRDAKKKGQRAVVFCHFPVLEAASTPHHLLWDHEEVLRILFDSPAAVAYMNGHDHAGGYAIRNGIHFVTFPAMVESGAKNAYGTVRVYGDRLEIDGAGTVPSRVLRIDR